MLNKKTDKLSALVIGFAFLSSALSLAESPLNEISTPELMEQAKLNQFKLDATSSFNLSQEGEVLVLTEKESKLEFKVDQSSEEWIQMEAKDIAAISNSPHLKIQMASILGASYRAKKITPEPAEASSKIKPLIAIEIKLEVLPNAYAQFVNSATLEGAILVTVEDTMSDGPAVSTVTNRRVYVDLTENKVGDIAYKNQDSKESQEKIRKSIETLVSRTVPKILSKTNPGISDGKNLRISTGDLIEL